MDLNFYPRPPRGGRHLLNNCICTIIEISIHALREEGDLMADLLKPTRLPFLSTPSARRATLPAQGSRRGQDISIHALREEGDEPGSRRRRGHGDFYPRPPRGGRRYRPVALRPHKTISIHALREEGDAVAVCRQLLIDRFLSTPSARRATRTRAFAL